MTPEQRNEERRRQALWHYENLLEMRDANCDLYGRGKGWDERMGGFLLGRYAWEYLDACWGNGECLMCGRADAEVVDE